MATASRSDGEVRGAALVDGTIVMIENQLLGVGRVADFAQAELVVCDDGDVLYTLPLASGDQVLMENAFVLLQTGDLTAKGRAITRFNDTVTSGAKGLAQSEDG